MKDISSIAWGSLDGELVRLWTLRNKNGVEIAVTNYGARIVKAIVPDAKGELADVMLGWDSLEKYVADKGTYFGASVGRYGNRIAHGKFTLDGVEYVLELTNEPNGIPCALHGGTKGFSQKVWSVKEIEGADYVGLELTVTSPDGEGGYPGNVMLRVTMKLLDDDVLRIEYYAITDKATPLAFTNHSYWNLEGVANGSDIADHNLTIDADVFTTYNPGLIPTGEMKSVEGTPFDFRVDHRFGDHEDDKDYPDIAYGAGYDMNWVVRRPAGDESLVRACTLSSKKTGRKIEVWTTEPGIQIYDGTYLPAGADMKGVKLAKRGGIALETQHFPDSPNHPEFPTTIARPGKPVVSMTEYRFGTI